DRGIHDVRVGFDHVRSHAFVDGAHEWGEPGFELHRPTDPRHELRNGHRFPPRFSSNMLALAQRNVAQRARANRSSSLTRRSVSPCSWVYWSSASIDGRFGSMP